MGNNEFGGDAQRNMILRQAAQQALAALETYQSEMSVRLFDSAVAALRAALAEDAMQRLTDEQQEMKATIKDNLTVEPVAWLDPWTQANVTTDYDAYGKHGIPLYADPPQRKPLTDEEIKRIKPISVDFVSFRSGVRCAERAHGIGDAE